MPRKKVFCRKCGGPVEFNDAGEQCQEYHGSPYIIECDCTGIPVANWDDVETPDYWHGVGGFETNPDSEDGS